MKLRPGLLAFVVVVLSVAAAACSAARIAVAPTESSVGIANPASEYCQQNGGSLEIRTAADGGQAGYCLFADGTECEEWAFFRGDCQPSAGTSVPPQTAAPGLSPASLPLQVLLPEDGSQIDIPQCQVVGTTSPGAVVSVNDEIVIAGEDGSFRATVILEAGVNLIEVISSDSSGGQASVDLVVSYEP